MQFIDWNKVDELGQDLINYAENDLKNQIEGILQLKNNITWEGADADTAMQGFTGFMQNMQKLNLGTKQYGMFLKGVSEKYKTTTNEVKNTFEEELMASNNKGYYTEV